MARCKLASVGCSTAGNPDSTSVCGKAIDEGEHEFSWSNVTCENCRAVRAAYIEETLRGLVDPKTGALFDRVPFPNELRMQRKDLT